MKMGIEDLERLNKLPKTIASPEMDLEKLKRIDEYIRRQWWDEIRRVEGEYLTKFVPEGATNGFLEANIVMSKLKLVVSFLDNGERSPEHGFKDDQMDFVRSFDVFKVYDILSETEIAEYVRRGREDERGIVRLARDAALKGYDQMDKIMGSKIRGDLALAFKRVYSDRLKKMELAATEYIRKYGIGPGGAWEDIEGAIEKSVVREELEKKEAELKSEREGLEYEKKEVEERLGKIKAILEGGTVKRFVVSDVAKIHEMNYIGRFDIKMNELPRTIYDPIERKERRINVWSYHYKFDDADRILNLNTLKMDYEEATGKLPLNLRSRYVVAEKRYKLFGKEETKVIIEVAVLGHLLDYADNGFDTRSVTLSELLSVLTRYIDNAELGNYFHVLGVASVTGFDEKVFEHINSGNFHKNFVSRYVSLCLVDLETGDVFYNESDERIKPYIELFKPVFDAEKVKAIKEYVIGRLELKDFAVLDRVVEEATDGGEEGRRLAKKVFYDLEKEGMGKVKYEKEFGVVVEK